VVVHHNPDTGPVLVDARKLGRIGLSRYSSVAVFVVPDVVRADAAREQVVPAFVPDTFPPVE
jgi:hypothetical protein